ncbi:hypothetical protein VTK73DRAFT_9964 [Phialemonium thermophilum]|uniref:Zn(2)-C6 fungal-type domain-containing protein n=1 Tax=Phialemonium thermophilum TaxID=223376 RepID=A0ABR3VZ72_9PEZI
MSRESPSDRDEPGSNHDAPASRKRPRHPASGGRYPRKRSLKACLVCRARKTKCDNVRPTCGFCASIHISCSYDDDKESDPSTFDPASLEILRRLGHITSSQDALLQLVRSVAASQSQCVAAHVLPTAPLPVQTHPDVGHTVGWHSAGGTSPYDAQIDVDFFAQQQQPESASTTPSASASVAAVRWFDLLANDASRDALDEVDLPPGLEGGFLDLFNGQDEGDLTPLQRATKAIDGQLPPVRRLGDDSAQERSMWQTQADISLLDREQGLFKNFLHRICSWLDLFDPARTISTTVPHLAVRNAGLMNAILALSGYHQSLDDGVAPTQRTHQNTALQYYYQCLHYVQKAMRYPTYQTSRELLATTLIISTYEMLRGSRRDWQQHLQGVFWILRSRQIEVETVSLESAAWWAWLGQDIWVAFRQRRQTYSTWIPKKTYAELDHHELASRALWILAQVVNFCAVDPSRGTEGAILGRLRWATTLRKMLEEWESHLTVEFSQLPAVGGQETDVFRPRLIHPPCFGLAVQIHHVSRILVTAHEPSLGGLENFTGRQRTIQESIDVVCGIGMTLTETASSILSSQCVFIAGMFVQDPRQRKFVLDLLDRFRTRCGWPTPSLGVELHQIWNKPDST